MTNDSAVICRLFFALWPDHCTRTSLVRLQQPLADRLMHAEDLHITMAFLGQQPASLLPVLHRLAQQLPRFDLTLRMDRIGYFPRSRIAWLGMQLVPTPLVALHDALHAALAQQGVRSAQHGSFTPHVTLARDAPPPLPIEIEPIAWRVGKLVLVQSISVAQGVRYRVLQEGGV